MKLFFRELGQGQPLIILHGLFGSSDNWYTLSKVFANQYRVFTVDQRNHGQSPHSSDHNYKLLTEDLQEFISDHQLTNPVILGHSMGGKTAMNFALKNPTLLAKLIVVDIMPKAYPLHHQSILAGMKSLDLATLESRSQADQLLKTHVPEPDVRQFLLKNLSRDDNQGFVWKINLPVLDANIEPMGAGLQYDGQFSGPTLFVKGSKSWYYESGDEKRVSQFFPNAEWITLETGHWVQAEKPEEFVKSVMAWLNKN